jgi:predicted dehydrogenase
MLQFPGFYGADQLPQDLNTVTHGAYLVSVGKRKRLVKFRKKNMFAEEWKNFRDVVSRGATPLVTGDIGRNAVEVALAVLRSGRTGKTVRIGGGK